MKMFLTCGKCWRGWTVARWSTAAMRCPKCGSESLSDGASSKEKERHDVKKEIKGRTHVEMQHNKAGQ